MNIYIFICLARYVEVEESDKGENVVEDQEDNSEEISDDTLAQRLLEEYKKVHGTKKKRPMKKKPSVSVKERKTALILESVKRHLDKTCKLFLIVFKCNSVA